MKQFLLASSLIFLSCNNTINSQQHKNDWQEEKLKGRVKSVRHIQYSAEMKNGKIVKGEINDDEYSFGEYGYATNYLILFNTDGNIVKKNHYRPDGTTHSQYSYKYDNKRNKIEEHSRYEDYLNIEYYSYNYKNQLIKIKDNQTIYTISYDDRNNTSIEKQQNGDYRIFNKYNNDGKIIEKIEWDNYNQIISSTFYKYDNKGNNIEKYVIGDPHILSYKDTFKYDQYNNPIEETRIKVHFEGDTEISKNNYLYEYDKYGNWIQQIEYSDLCPYPCSITERSIEYY